MNDLKYLLADHTTGKLRETVLWSHISKAAMTWAFIWVVLHGGSSEWLWMAYGGLVLSHESVARMFNIKQNKEGTHV